MTKMGSWNKQVQGNPVLGIENVTITYDNDEGSLDTVRNVSLNIEAGEIYGLVGESGSGKTTLARGIVRFLANNGRISKGSIKLGSTNLTTMSMHQMANIWGSRITMVHQDPMAAVNPSITIGEQIAEMARIHLRMGRSQAKDKAIEMLVKMGIPDPEKVVNRYAHQISGGMLQRVVIGIALTTNPQLLIMDEPTTALDVTTEAVILDLVLDLMADYNTAVLYITHDLGVVARICNRVGVMYAGEIVEEGTVRQVFKDMAHPYTSSLLGCVPRIDANKGSVTLNAIPGRIPSPDNLPPGCIFEPRCDMADELCRSARPEQDEVEPGHLTVCRRWPAMRQNLDLCASPKQRKTMDKRREEPIVFKASNVKKHFPVSAGLLSLFKKEKMAVKAVDDVSVEVKRGFTMGIVGESGCGKTTFARCAAGLEKATAGVMELEGILLPYTIAKRSVTLKKKMQMVFQNPDASFNPQLPVGDSVGRPLRLLRKMSNKEVEKCVRELFLSVRLPEDYLYRLPHELSGGEKQRVAIARAFSADPTLMICDEPITSLDVSVQASLMNLLVELQESKGTSYLFISHDLAAVRHISDWIAVMYLGRLFEVGPAEEVFTPPYHPYTEALLSAISIPDPEVKQNRLRLKGSVPSAVNIPSGCRFHTRCPRKLGSICEEKEPPWNNAGKANQICCHIEPGKLLELQKALNSQDSLKGSDN
jgi:peptide/nickel transport system ATP-binding protein